MIFDNILCFMWHISDIKEWEIQICLCVFTFSSVVTVLACFKYVIDEYYRIWLYSLFGKETMQIVSLALCLNWLLLCARLCEFDFCVSLLIFQVHIRSCFAVAIVKLSFGWQVLKVLNICVIMLWFGVTQKESSTYFLKSMLFFESIECITLSSVYSIRSCALVGETEDPIAQLLTYL